MLTENGIDYICQKFGNINECVVSNGLSWSYLDIEGTTHTETGATSSVVSRLIFPQLVVSVNMISPARGIVTYSQLRAANGGNDITLVDCGTIDAHDENSGDQWCYSEPSPCSSYTTQSTCEAAGCYWYNNACHKDPYVPNCSSYIIQSTCELAGCYWYNNACHNDPYVPKCSDYTNQTDCEDNDCFWYNGSCHNIGALCEYYTDQTDCEANGCYWYKKFIWEHESCHDKPLDPIEQYLVYGGIGAVGIAFIVLIAKRR